MGVLEHHWSEAESVVGFTEAGIPTAGQQLVERRTVAVAGIEVSAGIPGETKRIHLTVRVVLDTGTVEADAVGIARVQIHMTAVAGRDMGVVVEPVGRIKPAIEAAAERGLISMGITGVIEGPVQRGPLVGLAVAIGVFEQPDMGDAPNERLPMAVVGAKGIHPDGNIQTLGKLGHLAGATVWTKIFEDHHPVPTDPIGGRGPGIFDTGRDPKPTRRIEGEVHGLVDVGLVGHQLNFESGRQSEGLRLIGRTHGFARADAQGQIWIVRTEHCLPHPTESGNNSGDQTMASSRDSHGAAVKGTLSLREHKINPGGAQSTT